VAFSLDGSLIVSGSRDNTLRLWPAPKIWLDELCKKITRNMSHKEWREWVSPDIDYIEQCPGLPIPADETKKTSIKENKRLKEALLFSELVSSGYIRGCL